MFYVSIIATNANMVIYGILFGGMHLVELWLEWAVAQNTH